MSDRPGKLTYKRLALEQFTASLEQPDELRREWLISQCGHDEQLLNQVMRLYAADQAEGDLVSPVFSHLNFSNPIGMQVGAFEISTELGSGGMGTVYRGRRADGLYEQDVAIKLFRHSHFSAGSLQRFHRERQILAHLEHPGIARLIDGGTAEDRTPYVVMELIEGLPITAFCQQHRLNLTQRLQLMQKVCTALHAAHQRNIVHRDLKPDNILVGADGEPKLIDFGIAKQIDAHTDQDTSNTRIGELSLTPDYASPEQVRGKPVSRASDIYALGVLMYELLCGSRPYRIDQLTPAGIERIVCESIPDNPSSAAGKKPQNIPDGLPDANHLCALLRGDVDRIIMTAMHKSPTQRYASAQALTTDIQNHLSGFPVAARGASRWYRLRKFITRHPAACLASASAFAILAVALIVISRQVIEANQQASRAEAAKQFLVSMIGRSDPFENTESATLAGALQQAVPTIAEQFTGQPLLEAEMRYAIGYALQNLGETVVSRQQFEQSLALRNQFGSVLDQAESLGGLGIMDWWDSAYQEGNLHFSEAMQLLGEQNSERAVKLKVDILANWSAMQTEAGEHATSAEHSRQALQLAQQAAFISDETRANIWGNLATAEESLGNFGEAEKAFDNTLALLENSVGIAHPSYAIALNNYAFIFYSQQKYQPAMELFSRSVEIRRQTLGANHPQIATALLNLAGTQIVMAEYANAEGNAMEALAIAKSAYPAGHWRIGKAHQTLARLYAATADHDDAAQQATDALAIFRHSEGNFTDAIAQLEGIQAAAQQ